MLNWHPKTSTKIISLILAHVFLMTGLAWPEDGTLRSPMGFGRDGKLSGRIETVSQDALASNSSLPEREIYNYFGLDYSAEARKQGPLWLKLRRARLTMSEEADLAYIVIDLLQQEGNPALAIRALRIVLDEGMRSSRKYRDSPEGFNKNMKDTLVKGLRLLVQGIYADSNRQIGGYNSRQIVFLAERFIRQFVEDNYGVDNFNRPYLCDYYIDTSDEFLSQMIVNFLEWMLENAETYRPMRRRQLTRRVILTLGVAGVVTGAGYKAYHWFDPTTNTMEHWARLKDMPVHKKVSEDSRNQYIFESKYFGYLKKESTRNMLSEYDYNWLRGFLSNNRPNAVIFAARVFNLEPELLAGFLLEEHFYGETRNRLKQFLRELLEKDLGAHRDIERDSTVGLGQIRLSHAKNPDFLSYLKSEKEKLVKLLKPDDWEKLKDFLNYNTVEEIENSSIVQLLEIEEINIFLAAFIIRQQVRKIVDSNKGNKNLPDINPLSKHSALWLLGESEYQEIPTDELKVRYGRPFGGINYYHPLMRYFAVSQRYTGAGPNNFQRGMVKVKIYNMFLESGLFKSATDNRPNLPSRNIMAGV